MVHEVTAKFRRYVIKVPGINEEYEADLAMPTIDEISNKIVGITWFYRVDENIVHHGNVNDMPFIMIDRESKLTEESFMKLKLKATTPPPIQNYG